MHHDVGPFSTWEQLAVHSQQPFEIPSVRSDFPDIGTMEAYWFFPHLLLVAFKEKELRRQQSEILKHQVGIHSNLLCLLNIIVTAE